MVRKAPISSRTGHCATFFFSVWTCIYTSRIQARKFFISKFLPREIEMGIKNRDVRYIERLYSDWIIQARLNTAV